MNEELSLRPMTPAEIDDFRARQLAGYADEMIRLGGMEPGGARAKSAASMAELFPSGRPLPGHHLLVASRAGRGFGHLWLGPPPQAGTCDMWVFSIEVDPDLRGRGLGRLLMAAAEDYARERGATKLGLNVFGGNHRAIRLYNSLGYAVTSQQMAKAL